MPPSSRCSSSSWRPGVLWWLLVFMTAVWSFVRGYEEPALARQFGASYQRYRDAVPGWWPRLTPYPGSEA